MGNFVNRAHMLQMLGALPQIEDATDDATNANLERYEIYGIRKLSHADLRIVVTAKWHCITLLTRDKRQVECAKTVGTEVIDDTQG